MNSPRTLPAFYPGHALEALITLGDEAAAEVFGQWLPHSRATTGMARDQFPDEVLTDPRIRPVALRIVETTWSRATKGDVDSDGQTIRLAAAPAAEVLACLAASWGNRSSYRSGLLDWTDLDTSSDELAWNRLERAVAAYHALARLTLTESERAILADRFSWILDMAASESAFWVSRFSPLLEDIANAGLVPLVAEVLEPFAEPFGPFAPHVASMLVPQRSAPDAVVLSRDVAAGFFKALYPTRPGGIALRRLVQLAPRPWADALKDALSSGRIGSADATNVIDSLPTSLAVEVAEHWIETVVDFELPWLTEGLAGSGAFRPADRVRGVLFNLGVDPHPRRS